MTGGIDQGYNDQSEYYDQDLIDSLKANVAEFSAFKEASFQDALVDALVNDNKLLTWSEFKAEALQLHEQYNIRWLETEYHHTIAAANFANKWKGFEADVDLYPNLKIVTAGDERVRESHRILDGLTLPVNHSYWITHTIPFDWGCRCDIVQSDDEVSTSIPDLNIKSTFQHNPALDGKIFGDIPYAEGMNEDKKNEVLLRFKPKLK